MKKIRLLLLMSAVVALALVMAVPALANEYDKFCVGSDGVTKINCLGILFDYCPNGCPVAEYLEKKPVGDMYVDGVFWARTDGLSLWYRNPDVTIPAVHLIEVKNISDPSPEYGVLYLYQDFSTTVTTVPGKFKDIRVPLKKIYLRGTLELTCDIKNHAGEAVSCGVTIDGAAPASNASLTPGQKANYILDPGTHTVTVTLAGANATLWAPASFSKQVTIKASATATKLKAEFKKAGHLLASLDQPGVVGDWYLDGVQVGTQVATLDQWVTPGGSHKIEVKNLTDPAAGGMYKWKDASASASVASGKDKSVVVRLKKEITGFVITMPGNVKWFDSKVSVKVGQAISIIATGLINIWPQGGLLDYGPDGSGGTCTDPTCPFVGKFGALIGRIGNNGTPFLIGSHLDFTATSAGKLYFVVNDQLGWDDNTGSFTITILFK